MYPTKISKIVRSSCAAAFASVAFAAAAYGQPTECDPVTKYNEKRTEAETAATDAKTAIDTFNKLPALPAKPAGSKDIAALKKAKDDAEAERNRKIEAQKEAAKKLPAGTTADSLRKAIEDKKAEIKAKQDELGAMDTTDYIQKAGDIQAKEAEILAQMNVKNLAAARAAAANKTFHDWNTANKAKIESCNSEKKAQFNTSGIDYTNECLADFAAKVLEANYYTSPAIGSIRGTIQQSVTAMGAMGPAGTANVKVSHSDILRAEVPKLIAEMEAIRAAQEKAIGEYDKLDRQGIRQLQLEIEALRAEQKTLEAQLKPITDADTAVEAAKKAFETANSKFTEAEKTATSIEEWEKKEAARKAEEGKRDAAVTKKTTLEGELKLLEGPRDKAIAAKDAALAAARSAADAPNLRARLNVVNAELMEKARTEIFASRTYREDRAEATNQLKLAKTSAEKDKVKADFRAIVSTRIQERYIGLRNEAEATRLEGIRDGAVLMRYNCFTDVSEWRNRVSQLANNVRKLKVSTGTGADFEFEGENQKENINVGPIPPLEDLGGSDDDVTDDVPDDVAGGTGQVKVIQYFVFLLTNSSNGLYVGSEDSIKGRTRCSFVGGGIGCKPTDVITYRKLAGPFATQGEAQQALCDNITESRHFPLGIGLKGKWQGGQWYGLWDAGLGGCTGK
jgi:hypothetical protein